ncbi:hypothetical protein ACFLUO_01125 [Chloroflexota bacterium]
MPIVFGQEGRNLYNAFFIPDTEKRRAALEEWIKSTTPVIQAAVTQGVCPACGTKMFRIGKTWRNKLSIFEKGWASVAIPSLFIDD